MARRPARLGTALALLTAAACLPGMALAASSASGDFNGDGRDDLAVGVPTEDSGLVADSGAVHVIYGSSRGLSATRARRDQLFVQGSGGLKDAAEANDQFGRVLAVGDFNGDGMDDLAISAHLEDVGALAVTDAGIVHVIYGSSAGLRARPARPVQLFHQDTQGILDAVEDSDQFASSLTAGDFDNDQRDDLVVGVPLEDLDQVLGQFDSGLVHVIYGTRTGLAAAGNELFSQDTVDGVAVRDDAEADERFGGAVAAGDFDGDRADDLGIGVEFESVGGDSEAGAVNVLYGATGAGGLGASRNQFWTQDTGSIRDAAEGSDRFGLALAAGDIGRKGRADLAIGVPGESVGVPDDPAATNDAGAVNVLYGSPGGLSDARDQLWTQDSPGINGGAETFDFLGIGLAIGDFDGDGSGDLAIGVMSESVGSGANGIDAGGVNVIYSACTSTKVCRLTQAGDQFFSQGSPRVEGELRPSEGFGQALAAARFNGAGAQDLAIGVPREVVGSASDSLVAGAVNVIYGSGGGLTAAGQRPDQLWQQGRAGIEGVPELDDAFGAALAPGGSTALDGNLVLP